MNPKWRLVSLAEVGSSFATGPFGSSVSSKNFVLTGVPMLRGANLSLDVGVRLVENNLVHVPEELAFQYKRAIARKGDLVFTCWGTIGQIGFIDDRARFPEYLVSNKQMRMTPELAVVDGTFLYYCLSQPGMVEEVVGASIGSSVPGFNLGQLKRLEITLPELREQRAIAEVLGALDDKIAANDHLASSADHLACAAYLRASRTADCRLSTYGAVSLVGAGGTPRTTNPEFWGGQVPWATPTDITSLKSPYLDDTNNRITEDGLAACSSSLYPPMSVLMTSRATIGAFAMAFRPVSVNQGFIVAQAREDYASWWLFHEMRTRVPDYISHANGATFLELPRGRFKDLPVSWPEMAILQAFQNEVEPLHGRAYAAQVENRRLTALRDALLPELMSGRLQVKDAESHVGEVL